MPPPQWNDDDVTVVGIVQQVLYEYYYSTLVLIIVYVLEDVHVHVTRTRVRVHTRELGVANVEYC